MQVIFKGIKWDTDGETPTMELPTELEIEVNSIEEARIVANNDYADMLSDEYGYCIDSMGHVEVYDDNGEIVKL